MKRKFIRFVGRLLALTSILVPLVFESRAATIVWTNAAGGNWSATSNWNPNQVPSTNDTAVITVAGISNNPVTVTLDISPTVGGIILGTNANCGGGQILVMNSQTLTLAGPFSVNACGQFTLNSGILAGSTNGLAVLSGSMAWTAGELSGILTLATNCLLTIDGIGNDDMPGTILTNYGTVTWTAGVVRGGAGGTTIYNIGTWNAACDSTLNNDYNGNGTAFINSGIFIKSVGTNTSSTSFAPVPFYSTGTVNVQTGNLALDDGGVFTGGSAIGAGALQLTGGYFTISNTLLSGNVQETGGYLAGTNLINGTLSWVSGLWTGASNVTISGTSTLLISGTASHDLPGCAFTNNGTVLWTAGLIRGGEGTIIYNAGTWNAACDSVINDDYNGSGTVFTNVGTFEKTVGTNTSSTTFNNVAFDSAGPVNVATGYLVCNDGGILNGSTFTCAGVVQFTGGTMDLNGTVTTTGAGQVQIAGAVISGVANMAGTWVWTSGNFGGSSVLTLNHGSILALQGSGDMDMYGLFTNAGTIQLQSGTLRVRADDGPGQLVSSGLLDIQGDLTFDTYSGGTFYNFGTLQKSVGTNTSSINPYIYDAGIVNVESGTMEFVAGGNISSGSLFEGAGSVQLASGIFALGGTVTSSNVILAGSIINGTNAVMAGTWAWTAGYFAPTSILTLPTNSLLSIPGSGDMDLYGIFTNGGIIQLLSGALRTRADQGPGQLINLPGALVDIRGDLTFDQYAGGTVYNQGTIRKSLGTNTTDFNPLLYDSGTFDVESGNIFIQGGGIFNPGTQFIGPNNAYLYNATFTVNGNVNFSNIVMQAYLAGTNGVISGQWSWVGGYFTPASTLTIATNGILMLAGVSGDYDLFGALTNAGVFQLYSGTFRPRADQGPGMLVNLKGALLDSKTDLLIDTYAGGSIVNQGTFRKSGGTNVTTVNPFVLNSGTVDAQAAVISFAGGINLTNGTLNFGLSSLTNFGVITIPGAAVLSGTVSANLNNGYIPIATNTFAVLGYGSESGIFSNSILPFADAWQTNYSPTVFSLEVLNARPIIAQLTNQTVNELTTLTLTNTATDPDVPAQTLTFSLVSSPSAMTITPLSTNAGVISWTPAQTNSPSTNTISVVVTDNGSPSLSATDTFQVIVREVNVAPILPVVSTQTVSELTLLTVTNTAFETNIHATTTGYALVSPPAGMAINTNGIITWTPAQTQSPGTNVITCIVTNNDPYDLINPVLTSTNTFTVIVREVNVAPSLFVVPNQTVNELALLTVTNSATNFDIHATISGYVLINPPAGMAISASGVITWTPAQTQSPGTNTITTVVTNTDAYDQINPHLTATNTFTVVVREVNVAPALPTISTQTVSELTLLTVTNAATNANIHATNTGYGLINPPTGMAINSNGVITWTPAQTQSPGTNLITTVVTNTDAYDLVNPHLTATNTFTVIVKEVNAGPTLSNISTQTVNELTLLSVTNTAGETNIHATLGYFLLSPPAGAAINTNGIITWTPAQTQSPGTNTITTVVTNYDPYDSVNPSLSATNSFTVIVKEVNVAPVLPNIPTQAVYVQTLLTVTNTAFETNIHATLGYVLTAFPTGMAINSSGIITWTPTSAQSPSTNLITTVVTNTDVYDSVNPHLSATNTFTVIVSESNIAPVLTLIATQTVNELTLLTVTNAATEPNPHSSTTGYGLINPPAGAAINTNGVITWTPAQTQSPGTNIITTVVTNTDPYDALNPHLTATNSFTVIVKEVNQPPTLSNISTQTVNELTLLTVTNAAFETNIHASSAYTLLNPPGGMTINSNGVVSWTPAQTQSPGSYLVITLVTNTDVYDLVNPHYSASNNFTVVVKEVNVAPVLPLISTQIVYEGSALVVTNTAAESNIHATLGYVLVSPPAGMTISSSGIISWTPSQAESPGTNLVTTIVTNTDSFDLVNPHLNATNSFTVIVKPVPVLTGPEWLGNGQFQFSFLTDPGVTYTVLYSTNLTTWSAIFEFDGDGGEISLIDPNAGASRNRFYRIKAH